MSIAEAIPKMQKAVVVKPGSTRNTYEDIPVPTLKPGEILVRINWSGVCYNDVIPMRKHSPNNPRMAVFQNAGRGISGHEGVGNVVAIADDVVGENLWKIGDRVGIKWVASVCQKCEFCTNGKDEVNCPKGVYSGYTTPGTFQQYVTTDARFALPIPDGVSDEVAAPLLCSGLTIYAATKRTEVEPGQWVLFLGGGGGQGHLGIQYAKAMGMRVIAVDVGADKMKLCKDSGADECIDFSECKDLPAKVKEITEYGAHAVVIATQAKAAFEISTSLVRPTGRIVVTGFMEDPSQTIGMPPVFLASDSIKIIGSTTGTRKDAQEMFEYTRKGLVNPYIQKAELAEIDKFIDLLNQGKMLGKAVLKVN